MWRSRPAPTWSASCSFRRRRAMSASRRRARSARGCGAGRKRSRCRSMPTTMTGRQHRSAQARHAAAPRQGDAGARGRGAHRFGLPVMKALPIAERADLSPIRLYDKVADRLIFDARAPREATRPGGLGKPSTGGCCRTRPRRAVHALGRARCRQCRGGVAHDPCARRRCILRRRACAGRQGPRQDPRLHPRRAAPMPRSKKVASSV